jgi:calcium uniporter protein, mitochondrial
VSLSLRKFSTTRILGAERSAAVQAEVKHDGSLDRKIGEAKELQKRTPWHREGADRPPVRRLRSAGAMTKGNCDV